MLQENLADYKQLQEKRKVVDSGKSRNAELNIKSSRSDTKALVVRTELKCLSYTNINFVKTLYIINIVKKNYYSNIIILMSLSHSSE